MISEDLELMRTYARACLAGRSQMEALKLFLTDMHEADEIAAVVDDFIADATEVAAKKLLLSVASSGDVPSERSYAGTSDVERAPQKLLPDAMIVRWGASVAAGFNFILPDGTKLGDATRADLTKAADKFTAFGKEAHQKARWLLLIAQGLPQGQTVRERFNPLRLTELAIEAEKNTEIPA